MRTRTAVTGLVTAACAGVLLAPAPVAAAPKAGAHCVVQVASGKSACYDTFPEAVAAATGGRITDAPATPRKAARDKEFLARLDAPAASSTTARRATRAAAANIGGWLYEHGWYGGRSLTLSLSTSGCRSDGRWDAQVGWLGDYNFNDITSSVVTAGNCHVELSEHGGFQGARAFYDYAEWVGNSMNDQASAVRLKSAGENAS
ncbi:hypothetical protein JNUCC64_11670 [Streptomyces sp. JNUCC 64]